MPTDYVEDYEEVTGTKIPEEVTTKVVAAPAAKAPKVSSVAEVK